MSELDHFTLQEVITRGAFAGCWLSTDDETGDLVLIKKIMKKDLDNSSKLGRFCDEITLIQQMSHPLIAPIVGLVDSEDEIALIFDAPSQGCKLLTDYVLTNGVYSETAARDLINQLIEVLIYIRSNFEVNCCHMALDTIYVDKTGKLSMIYITNYETKILNHSPLMLSHIKTPEIISLKRMSEYTDVWFIGLLTYFILIGKLPFVGKTSKEVEDSILTSHPQFPEGFDSDLKDLINKMLTKNQLMRPSLRKLQENPCVKMTKSVFKRGFSTTPSLLHSNQLFDFANHSSTINSIPRMESMSSINKIAVAKRKKKEVVIHIAPKKHVSKLTLFGISPKIQVKA